MPGIPDCCEPSHILDIVCTHAAACDLAIADAGFRTTCIGYNINVMASLYMKAREASETLPRIAGTEGLLALMEFQIARLMATDIQVRRNGLKHVKSGNRAEAFTPITLDKSRSPKL